jgi:REP element-mobilizing transposase RayT
MKIKMTMSKQAIPLKAGRTYHIWTHANGDENLFRSKENYNYFLEKYQYHVHPVVDTFAYCLMPNHLHLMVRVKSPKEVLEFVRKKKKNPNLQGFENLGGFSNAISRQFSNLFNAYTKAFNKKYNRKGSLFMPNFRRKLIHSDEYFIRLIAYIHNNPIHHGFTENLSDWPFSSWHAYTLDKLTKIQKEEAMNWFGDLKNLKATHRNFSYAKNRAVLE